MTPKIALFASGSGSNVENIVRYFAGKKTVDFPLILSNKQDAFVHERAKMLGVPSVTFSRDEFADGRKIVSLLDKYEVDFIVLAGFLLKVSLPILEAYPNKIINIHPALLPKFGGKGMYGMRVHEAVIAEGDTESGITVHLVNERYDEGSIIFQTQCPVLPSDTPQTLADRIHQLEYQHYPRVVQRFIEGRQPDF